MGAIWAPWRDVDTKLGKLNLELASLADLVKFDRIGSYFASTLDSCSFAYCGPNELTPKMSLPLRKPLQRGRIKITSQHLLQLPC